MQFIKKKESYLSKHTTRRRESSQSGSGNGDIRPRVGPPTTAGNTMETFGHMTMTGQKDRRVKHHQKKHHLVAVVLVEASSFGTTNGEPTPEGCPFGQHSATRNRAKLRPPRHISFPAGDALRNNGSSSACSREPESTSSRQSTRSTAGSASPNGLQGKCSGNPSIFDGQYHVVR